MGRLSSSLVDRARVVRRVPAGPRVEGRTPMSEVAGDWTPARLVPADAPERDDGHGLQRVQERGEVVLAGDPDVRASDVLEVQSGLLGAGRWQVSGAPRRAASTRRVRAVVIPVSRVLEPVREDA